VATPQSDNYSAATGQGIYGGRFNRPAWRRDMPPETWATIPATNKLSDLNPANDPLINPDYPSAPEWMGNHANIIGAWCGACNNDAVLWLPLSGGHADYGGNEPYRINLMNEPPTWEMVRYPSGAVGNVLTTRDGQESTGLYSDGRPRAIHSYNKPVYVPDVGPVISVQGSTWYSGQSGTTKPIFINPVTGEMDHFYGAPSSDSGTSSGSGACYDPSRHAIWRRGAGTAKVQKFDIATQVWTNHGSLLAWNGYVGVEYLPDHDCLFIICGSLANDFAVFDCDTSTYYYPSVSGALQGLSLSGACQPRLIPGTNSVAVWNNSTDTTLINTLSFTTNPRTDIWAVSQLSVAAENSVTPTVRAGNGTYGRFFYSPSLDGFGVINATNQPIYFYARS
jgi:hypothetical protein